MERILYICHDGALYGSQQSLHLLVKHLPSTSFQSFVSIARKGPLNQLLKQYPYVQVLSHQRVQWVKHDERTWWQRVGDVIQLFAIMLPRTWYLFNTIREQKINLVHTNSTVSLEGALAAALAGVPHVWHIREMFMEKSPKFHMVLGCRVSRWLIDRFSDAVICNSEAVVNQFEPYIGLDPGKYQVIYNALELDGVEPLKPLTDPRTANLRALSNRVLELPDSKHFRVGYIGRLSEGKRLHDLLDAVGLLHKQEFYPEVLVVGSFVDDYYRSAILDQIGELGLAPQVQFLGYLENLNEVFNTLDVLVVPSQNEPFGRVVIEAMLAGVPVIGTNSGGIPEIIEDGETGLLYEPGDIETLASMLEELSVTFWKLETMRQNARRMVEERFTIDRQVRTLTECYRSILKLQQF